MILHLLVACGVQGELPQPQPPPAPPPELPVVDESRSEFEGLVADLSVSTRSWTAVGDGKRMICVLGPDGRILANGQDVTPDQLLSGDPIKVVGRQFGDVLVVESATVTRPQAAAGPEATPTPAPLAEPVDAPTPPAAPAPEAPPVPAEPAPAAPTTP